jgi:phosphoglycolate phosphatase-like HAD superfamily hydrolase
MVRPLKQPLSTRAPQLPLFVFPEPAALLFDLDGTLVDTMGSFADLASEIIAKRYGLARRNARKLYLQTSGVPFCQQLDVIFGASATNAEAAEEYEQRKHGIATAAVMDERTRLALSALRRRGVRLVVSSNGMQEHVDGFAGRTGGLFELALGFGAGLAKGEAHIAQVGERLRIGRSEMAFVGDSIRDGELAQASGVRFIGRAGTFTRAELQARFPGAPVVDHVADVATLF